MNKFKNPMIAAAVFAGLGLIGSIMNSHPSVQAATLLPPINVAIDPSTLPLHVTGSTTVTGTVAATQSGPWNVGVSGTVAATQSGPWNVGVSGTVGIAGVPTFNLQTPTTPIPVTTNPGKALVQVSVTQNSPGNTCCASGVLYHNGSTKTLVIEFVSLFAEETVASNGSALLTLTTTANGASATHYPVEAVVMGGNLGVGSSGTHVRLYADPNTDVTYGIRRADNTGTVNYLITLSGYQTDTP
jgi:hypothetical protein